MKKKTTVDLIEESEVVSLYSISFEIDRTTEFERFLEKFENQAEWNKDYQKVLYAISLILDHGALERYFRPEGKISDEVCAIPVESGNIRLYCLRISDEILVIGNVDIKHTATYEEDQRLLGYVLDLQKFEKLLQNDIEAGIVTVEKRHLLGIEEKTYEI